jgi:hypothetical protein
MRSVAHARVISIVGVMGCVFILLSAFQCSVFPHGAPIWTLPVSCKLMSYVASHPPGHMWYCQAHLCFCTRAWKQAVVSNGKVCPSAGQLSWQGHPGHCPAHRLPGRTTNPDYAACSEGQTQQLVFIDDLFVSGLAVRFDARHGARCCSGRLHVDGCIAGS